LFAYFLFYPFFVSVYASGFLYSFVHPIFFFASLFVCFPLLPFCLLLFVLLSLMFYFLFMFYFLHILN
jgi:hypothetical protein